MTQRLFAFILVATLLLVGCSAALSSVPVWPVLASAERFSDDAVGLLA